MSTKKGANVSKAAQRSKYTKRRKYKSDPENKKQAVKKSYDSKKVSTKQYEKERNVENRTFNITFKKAKYHENPRKNKI